MLKVRSMFFTAQTKHRILSFTKANHDANNEFARKNKKRATEQFFLPIHVILRAGY